MSFLDPMIERRQLPCGCSVGLVVQQQVPCAHNDGRYPHDDLDLEETPCGCDEDHGCDRCHNHRFVFKRRHLY